MTTTTSLLGNSSLRGSTSRQTRINPTRTSKIIGTSLRQNSLVSNTGNSVQGGAPEPHGFYPAITHFADAITALPRDYRRHASLLKEADAKAWAPEESLHKLLEQCLADNPLGSPQLFTTNGGGVTLASANEGGVASAANSVVGVAVPDNVSQYSSQSAEPALMQRRQLYAALRHNLMQIMITMDEKNHVINNANDELLRHVRRLDAIWPHISDEISEEARLGSLKHWAYTETNPTKKVNAPTTRREAAASLAILHDSEVAHRSESRREAMMARKQRNNNLAVESDFDEARTTSRRGIGNGKKRIVETIPDPIVVSAAAAAPGKRKRPDKPALGGVAMERTLSSALGGRPMSREPSQQESKKRKAPASAANNAARKRLNVNAYDSPKLASSPLASNFTRDIGKQSPALSSVRPVSGKARQNASDGTRARPNSSAASKNNGGLSLTTSTSELNNIAAVTGKTANEVKNSMKESVNNRGDRLIEENVTTNGDIPHPVRGGLLLERTSSKQSHSRGEAKRHDEGSARAAPSPRLPAALVMNDKTTRGRASKHSTPVVETFAEAADSENHTNTSYGSSSNTANSNGMTTHSNKLKRPTRPRLKDHHGLQDSLSPKGLPMKRSHKKVAGVGSISSQTGLRLSREDSDAGPGSTSNTLDGQADHAEDEDDNVADDEERYCYCNGVSYGEMVACDNKDCPLKWFHLECIGLKSAPRSAKWYCEECKDNLARKGKFGASLGNGNGHTSG